MKKFIDRYHAGQILADLLGRSFLWEKKSIVLALPRGGVPVAFEIAKKLSLPLDVFVVRKLGKPGYEELAMGALASGGAIIRNEDIIKSFAITAEEFAQVVELEEKELERREKLYRSGKGPINLCGKKIILVDDGIATGATMKAAIAALRAYKVDYITVAVPVAPKESYNEISLLADEIVCLLLPEHFQSVGIWYENFLPTQDAEVIKILNKNL